MHFIISMAYPTLPIPHNAVIKIRKLDSSSLIPIARLFNKIWGTILRPSLLPQSTYNKELSETAEGSHLNLGIL
ncbi:hypothetical protein RchiOBHm_Chr3g0461131 [Rosa chinensis]|uniref:Uncharacterized protein n=1 Tax=Rosa chinensis TaxID=74649 RepID=A0A2P6R8J0_ROSCH|nr:hypothetical protein RchiOBHm_Chr3g0461131 [Rosa chinensis]